MQMPRTHKKNLGNTFDTVASHSHHTSVIAYCIARMEKLNQTEAMRASVMAVYHDLAEARTGDLDFVSKNYTKDNEEKAISDQFHQMKNG